AKALAKILMDELGITDALDCFLKGDMGGCLATAVNVAGAAIGGALGKLAVRYGAPWKWKKLANLTSRVKGLLIDLVDNAKAFIKCKNSFVPGTLVVMADGSRKPIEDVKTGDMVLVTDPVTGKTTIKPVVATIIGQGSKNLVEVTIDPDGDSGDATERVVATDNHPFWVAGLDEWVGAADLRAGQWLRTSAGTHVQISATRQWTEPARVYNLTVDDIHTYYVLAGNTSVLVHNCDWTSDANLFKHFDKHVMGVDKPGGVGDMREILDRNDGDVDLALDDYASCAQRFLCDAATAGTQQQRRDSDGALVRVNTKTRELGVLGDNGIVTYFKADNPEAEFLQELRK
ncbi:polymorphic toxin-type HINT domain-containing protein, partial [Micromonospora tulbaghiae]